MLQGRVLILNSSYEAIGTMSIARAMCKISRADSTLQVLEWDDNRTLKTSRGDYPVPSVLRLTYYLDINRRRNKSGSKRLKIYIRDKYRCFKEGTRILMHNGTTKPIELCEIGDAVIDANGNIQTIEYVHSRNHTGNIFNIYTRGSGVPVCVTADHKMLAYSKEGAVQEVYAKDITTTHYFSRPVFKALNQTNVIDLYKYCEQFKYLKVTETSLQHYCGNITNRFIKLNKDFGKLIGCFLSEGSISGNNIEFSFHINETEYQSDVIELVKKVLGLQCYIDKEESKNLVKVRFGSTIFKKFLLETIYKDGDKQHNFFMNDLSYLQGVLSGVIHGDAHINEAHKRVALMMDRPELIKDLYYCSLAVGLNPTISKVRYRKDGRLYQELHYNAYEYNKLLEICNLQKETYSTKYKSTDLLRLNDRVISKVTHIETSHIEETVYDLQISGSHTFVAEGVCVHNCQYCGLKMGQKHLGLHKKLEVGDLTLDHIFPSSRGGKTIPENLVTSCKPCNQRKADRTPEEARMPLLTSQNLLKVHLDKILMCNYAESSPQWQKYLFMDNTGDEKHSHTDSDG